MQRFEVFFWTGKSAKNEKIARRLNRKLKSLLSLGQTVLLDYDRVEVIDDAFFSSVLNLADLGQVKVCGLSPPVRAGLLDRNVDGAGANVR
jgi:hypothetical protein